MVIGCQSSKETPEELPSQPESMKAIWQAHGGLDTWNDYGLMQFTLGEGARAETHRINLSNRKVLIESDSFRLGMDGERVWVQPSLEAFGRDARFYHNLIFYFAAIPFVFDDPGVNIESLGEKVLDGKTYQAIAVSFDKGTGDADADEYIMLVNPKTNLVEWLLYTVTYFSGEKGDSYNALHYGDYRNVNGLMVAGKLTGYQYANDTTGAMRYENTFTSHTFMPEPLPDDSFIKPENAQYHKE